jgi:hypothetical protein
MDVEKLSGALPTANGNGRVSGETSPRNRWAPVAVGTDTAGWLGPSGGAGRSGSDKSGDAGGTGAGGLAFEWAAGRRVP